VKYVPQVEKVMGETWDRAQDARRRNGLTAQHNDHAIELQLTFLS
jgi:hypothetical protein